MEMCAGIDIFKYDGEMNGIGGIDDWHDRLKFDRVPQGREFLY